MRSEIQRVRMLAIVLAALLAATLIAANFFPEFTRRMFRGGIAGWEPLAAIGPFVLYEVVVLFVLRWRAAQDKDFPRIGTLRQCPGRDQPAERDHLPAQPPHGASAVLGFWPPMLYFVFILLSTLRLDFWLSLWTGAVAAVQLLVAGRLAAADRAVFRRAGARARLQSQPQHRAAGLRRHRRHRGRQPAPAVRGVGRRGGGARPRHQPVRPARLARRGRPAARLAERPAERDAPGVRAVPRHQGLHRHVARARRPTQRWPC